MFGPRLSCAGTDSEATALQRARYMTLETIPSVSTASFVASRAIAPDSMACILDVQTMQKSGGSLVVESTQSVPSRIFQVHWAGARTSNNRDDCGGSADLLLNSYQISALIFAAGGTGVKTQN